MAYFNEKFKRVRLDQSPYLFHFVNGRDKNPGETLQKILEERKLKSDKGYICFSASPITAIKRFFETKQTPQVILYIILLVSVFQEIY